MVWEIKILIEETKENIEFGISEKELISRRGEDVLTFEELKAALGR